MVFVSKRFITYLLSKSACKLKDPYLDLLRNYSCRRRMLLFDRVFHRRLCSTILAEEKAQQEERSRMEMRRQVPVSWDSGGSDEAPPKVSNHALPFLLLNHLTTDVLMYVRTQKEHFIGLFRCFSCFYVYGSLSSSGTADLLPRLTACHHLSP